MVTNDDSGRSFHHLLMSAIFLEAGKYTLIDFQKD
jgi:hypothetical protein